MLVNFQDDIKRYFGNCEFQKGLMSRMLAR